MMKTAKRFIILMITVIVLGLGMAGSASASCDPEYYEAQVERFEKMKKSTIKGSLLFDTWYVTKESKLWGRRVEGVNDDGSFRLSSWILLDYRTNEPMAFSPDEFSIPGTFVHFAYSFDISWGTDWPFSGIFWTHTDIPVESLDIKLSGTVREASIQIKINNKVYYSDYNLDSHSEWTP